MLPPVPERWYDSAHYLKGVELFNRGEFWESHEAWEEIWLEADGVQSEYLQGLIQCAAALLKYARNEPSPAGRLYETAMRRLRLCPDEYMGLKVRDFEVKMEAFRKTVLESGWEALEDDETPRIELKRRA